MRKLLCACVCVHSLSLVCLIEFSKSSSVQKSEQQDLKRATTPNNELVGKMYIVVCLKLQLTTIIATERQTDRQIDNGDITKKAFVGPKSLHCIFLKLLFSVVGSILHMKTCIQYGTWIISAGNIYLVLDIAQLKVLTRR